MFLGPTADTARFLTEIVAAERLDGESAAEAMQAAAAAAVRALLDAGRRVPGLGHPVHKDVDPRVPRLYALAEETGVLGPHMRLLEAVRAANEEISGRRLPINGAGAAGAALADLGLPPEAARGFALLARTAGLVGASRRGGRAAARHAALPRDRPPHDLRAGRDRRWRELRTPTSSRRSSVGSR